MSTRTVRLLGADEAPPVRRASRRQPAPDLMPARPIIHPVERDVPVPPALPRRAGPVSLAVKALRPGESVLIAPIDYRKLFGAAKRARSIHGPESRYHVRREGSGGRVWRAR